ncbi:MAG: amidohydrolase [Nanohaloarchaea archaeon]|nr:amidohydrolase [Candidatus Nanohaloarchaea archaeon]
MILQNIRYLVTQNENREVLEYVDLRIKDDRIVEIGGSLDYDDRKVDSSDRIVIPGLINAHTHASMTLLRGISDNKELERWLNEDIFPAEEKLDEQDAYIGALLGSVEMLKSGTTTFNDMYFHMDSVAEAVKDSGIRAMLSVGMIDIEEDTEEELRNAVNFLDRYRDENRIVPGIAPHSIYTCSNELLRYAKNYSKLHDVPFHIHVSETMQENSDALEEHGMTPVEYLKNHGMVDEDLIAAHSTWLTNRDRKIMEENNATVAHNPAANLKLGSGIADINSMMENGINVALGTDGAASNNSLNLFQEMKLTGLLHKRDDPSKLTEQDVLDMATINGAKALGMEDEIGSIEEGKKADLAMIDVDKISMNPRFGKDGLISNLVYSFNGNVSEVLVDGDLVVEEGKSVEIHENNLVEEVRDRAEKFQN